ncbi:hypothetical protein [Flavobacterium capsici]|uniref:Uncharacterized protein n=1 Tax=Flavobacterium capsici TaxID=3075618 RepID=A0AA96F2I3_9FLAO|nr:MULTISPECIES: hypothetical protein [unclassified Flavobacterium]WNM18939.1 hypothetical protein RN608_13110 [Flavobacterium sp. PMR2A8]WNM22989.1 hypothetical protein RN605_06410 [Flavobacterium sp. PMTSA4]
MKKYFLLTLLFSILSFSQTKESLQKATTKFHQAIFLMDFEDVKSLTYPKIYESIGETAFLEKLDQDYQNSEYRMRLQLEKVPFLFNEIKTIGQQTFCVVRSRNPKRYFFENKLNSVKAEEKKTWLQEKEKTQNVTFEPNRNSFNVKAESIYVAVFDLETFGEWKFFNLDDAFQLNAFNSLFDENIKNTLGLGN